MQLELSKWAHPYVERPFTAGFKRQAERAIWLLVLSHQVEWGLFDGEVYDAYEAARKVDTSEREDELELITRHDVKARIEAWNEVVGHEAIHAGLTSADIVDNVAQIQLRSAAFGLIDQLGASRMFPRLTIRRALDRQRIRGIWGAVGTGLDMVEATGRNDSAAILSDALAREFGFHGHLWLVGQQYPRSIDLDLATACIQATAQAEGNRQFLSVAGGYLSMLAAVAGEQWNEGDVSSSVVRRVAIPGVMLACSAALKLQ